jgi:hypothetical protein
MSFAAIIQSITPRRLYLSGDNFYLYMTCVKKGANFFSLAMPHNDEDEALMAACVCANVLISPEKKIK